MPKVDPDTRDIDDFAENMQHILAQNKKKISDLIEITGYSKSLVHRWMRGETRISEEPLNLIAEYFEVSPAYLRYGALPVDENKLAEVIELIITEFRQSIPIEEISSRQLATLTATVYEEFVNQLGDAKKERIQRLVHVILAGR